MNHRRAVPGATEPLGRRHTIVCIATDDPSGRLGHGHVISAETRDGASRRWSIIELIAAARQGEQFVVDVDGEAVEVSPAVCPRCPMVTLTSDPAEALLGAPQCREA